MANEKFSRLTKHREYLSDYRKDASGKYVYTGKLYVYGSENGRTRGRAYTELWILSLAAFAAVIACGFMYVPGMTRCAYVLIPYAAGLLSGGSILWGVINLTVGGDPMERMDYESTVVKIPGRASACAVCTAITGICEAVYLILNGIGEYPAVYTVLFFILECISCGTAILIRMLMRRLEWTEK